MKKLVALPPLGILLMLLLLLNTGCKTTSYRVSISGELAHKDIGKVVITIKD